jgi:choline dehydrogenase-like flavoprotein
MDGRRAVGVTYYDKATGERVSVDADRVIVAGGTIESAKLLLRSKSNEWPDGVGNQNDMVGRHLITHPYFVYTGTLNENPRRLQPEMNFPTLVSRYYDSPAEQRAGKFVLVNPPDPVEFYLAPQMQAGNSRAAIDAALIGSNKIQMHGMIEVFGRFDNRVTNLPKLNHMGMPETIVDYTKDPEFDQRMKDLQLIVTRIFVAMGATLTDKPSISWRADHAASTCRMSVDEKQGVVDANLRVHGTENLYVCSNATYPNIGAVNPTLTLTALSLRLGDHLNDGAS